MPIIRKEIKYTGNDLNIQIPISGDLAQLGLQQEIDEFVMEETTGSINGVTDVEVSRFKYAVTTPQKLLNFAFYDGSQWYPYFTVAGFTAEEITTKEDNFSNSFFILDFFDTYDAANQTKIFSAYITNLGDNIFIPTYAVYKLVPDFQLFAINIPHYFTDVTGATVTGYCRFSFYNAKTGKISVFYNRDVTEVPAPANKMFFTVELNVVNKTWEIITPSMSQALLPSAFGRELVESPEYVARYNDTFGDFKNQRQNYPTGNIFIDDGTYITG